jgi:hypothetical protein
MKKIQVLNLSIGGPDFKDTPFVEKVRKYFLEKQIFFEEKDFKMLNDFYVEFVKVESSILC